VSEGRGDDFHYLAEPEFETHMVESIIFAQERLVRVRRRKIGDAEVDDLGFTGVGKRDNPDGLPYHRLGPDDDNSDLFDVDPLPGRWEPDEQGFPQMEGRIEGHLRGDSHRKLRAESATMSIKPPELGDESLGPPRQFGERPRWYQNGEDPGPTKKTALSPEREWDWGEGREGDAVIATLSAFIQPEYKIGTRNVVPFSTAWVVFDNIVAASPEFGLSHSTRFTYSLIWAMGSHISSHEPMAYRDKHQRKRFQRAKPPIPEIHVLTLTRSEPNPDSVPVAHRRPYTHSIPVIAHWRNQACGPGWKQHKRILIAEHVRLPDLPPDPRPRVWKAD